MKKQNLYRLLLLITLSACATYQSPAPVEREPGTAGADLPVVLERAREYLISNAETKVRLKKVPESQFVEFLQGRPEFINERADKLVAEVESQARANNDPTKHTRLLPPPGKPGYTDLKIYVNHPYYMNGSLKPKDDLIATWIAFINRAQKEIILNVFDFDLQQVAQALIAKAKSRVKVQVGIDKGVVAARPEVKKVADMLRAGGVKVTEVSSVGLNHQKVTAIDWSDVNNAAVLFSSGNLTASCISKDGDLGQLNPVPKESVPNANHLMTMKSWVLANLVKHELTKTLDDKFLLRGKDYPINGSYQVTGPGVDPETLEAYPEPSVIITFSPNGGQKNINKNLIAHIVKKEKGPIRMLQFAFSSPDVEQALLYRAQQDRGNFDFKSVGDTPFAMRDWSRFLIMSGMKLNVVNGKKNYVDDPQGAWWQALGEANIKKLRQGIYCAPKVYGDNHLKIGGQSYKASAKIHHKILATPNFAIVGTSFNFSKGAESNQEQLLVFRDKNLSRVVDGMVKFLAEGSKGTVNAEALRRNQFAEADESDGVEDRQGN